MKRSILIMLEVWIILTIAFMAWIVHGQEIETSVTVEQGSLHQYSRFSSTEITKDGLAMKNSYGAKLNANHIGGIDFKHNFNGQASTEITGYSNFGVPGIRYEEKFGTEQVNGKDCCAAAGGSKISVFGIANYKTEGSPGGTGECCGVNYTVDAEAAEGRMQFGYVEHQMGEIIIPAEGEDGEDVTTFGSVNFHEEMKAEGNISNFHGLVTAPPCPPVDETPGGPLFHLFKLCPWDADGGGGNFGVIP